MHYSTVHYSIVQCSTVLSAIKAYNGYQPRQKVLWINPAANVTFLVITPETAGFEPLTPGTGGKSFNHSAVRLGKSLSSTKPEIYLLVVIHFKCMAVLFGLSPEGKYNTVSNQSLQPVSARDVSYHAELLPSLTAEWLETSPPNTGVEGLNLRGL